MNWKSNQFYHSGDRAPNGSRPREARALIPVYIYTYIYFIYICICILYIYRERDNLYIIYICIYIYIYIWLVLLLYMCTYMVAKREQRNTYTRERRVTFPGCGGLTASRNYLVDGAGTGYVKTCACIYFCTYKYIHIYIYICNLLCMCIMCIDICGRMMSHLGVRSHKKYHVSWETEKVPSIRSQSYAVACLALDK